MCKEPAAGNLSVGQRANQGNMQEQEDTTNELIKACDVAITAFTFDISGSLLSPHPECN